MTGSQNIISIEDPLTMRKLGKETDMYDPERTEMQTAKDMNIGS